MLHHSSPSVDQAGQGTASGTGYKITAYAEARVIELARDVVRLMDYRLNERDQLGTVWVDREIGIQAETARLWCCVPLKDSTGFQHA
jgi:hypothetical protein